MLDILNGKERYSFDKSIDLVPIEMYSKTHMVYSPNIWFWKSNRYQPFIGMESIYNKYSGNKVIDPLYNDIFSEDIYLPFASHLMNIEYGFLVKGFKVSYRWINAMNLDVTNTATTYSIPQVRHLEVMWQFLN